tara:strand:- start:757 stop:1695 length:939 start_codon:yes stop_codon:yes gene_type:complete
MSNNSIYKEEFDIIEIIKLLWLNKFLIISITTVFAIFSVFYALSLPNHYTSSALLKVTEKNETSGGGGLAELASRYGNIASMAGVSIPSSGVDNATYAIQVIKSREFAKHLMTFPDIKLNLMAVKSFDKQTKDLLYDDEIYDIAKKTWIRESSNFVNSEPTYLEVHETALKGLVVNQSDITGLITISFEHLSPIFARDFVSLVISEINNITREIKLEEVNAALDFLKSEQDNVNQLGLKNTINALISSQMNDKMMASIKDDYMLTIIDPPIVPEIKSSPKRAIICILITIFGGLLSLVIVLFKSFVQTKSNE